MLIVTSIVTHSIVSGTANAFLTLRVGIITRQYSNGRVTRDKKLIRKSAIAEAAAAVVIPILSFLAPWFVLFIFLVLFGMTAFAIKKWIVKRCRMPA